MSYDPIANIMLIEITSGKISHAREFGNFIIHFSQKGKPVLIEILNASNFITQLDKIKNLKNIKNLEETIVT